MYAARDRRRAEPRILYWFRTPPHVRVGRAALDEEAIRSIEEHNPDLTFDWTRILKAKPPPPPAEEGPRDRRRRERGAKDRRAERPPAKTRERRRREPPAEAAPPVPVEKADRPTEPPPAGTTEAWSGPGDEPASEPEHPALPPGLHVEERLGPEGFSRLRARHAELMARITERVQDPARLEELRTEAERLNPDTWITDEEAKAGIEGFDAAYEALRSRLGRRRRRSRRGGARRRRSPEGQAGVAGAAAADGAPPDDMDEPAGPADAAEGGEHGPAPAGGGGDDEPE